MNDSSTKAPEAESDNERHLREINEALLVSSVHQHELTEQAEKAEAVLRESEERLTIELATMQRLQEISTQLIQEENVKALHEQILDAAVVIMHADMASMQILDEGQDALRMLAWTGFDPTFGKIFELNRRDAKTSCSLARRVGHRVVIPDVETCDFIVGTPALEDHRKTGIRAVQSTPLFSRGGPLLGMLSTHWRQPHQPGDSDLRLLDVLARQAADLIERKQAQEQLRQLANDLERRVAERTGELQQANAALLRDMQERKKLEDQLLQAQKMETIGVLAGGIAHDFNNLLNIIQGYAFLLRGYGAQNKEIGESLNVIDQTVQRGSALVQQLLTLARKSATQLEPVDANVLVEGLIALIKSTFPRTIELSSDLEADLPLITADKNQLEQALLNLCVNARDAMPDGGRLIFKTQTVDGTSLQGFAKATEEHYVCIEVSDTGTGIDPSMQKRIFEPFFTTKEVGQGTGLGLAVAYGIVTNHRGFINVESKPESGTSFKLYLPSGPSLGNPVADRIAGGISAAPEQAQGRGTILLVEDEKNMLDLLERILLRQGYKALIATDGEMALNIWERNKETIDAVLLDIGLPKTSGQNVLFKMREHNPNIKVVVTSGYLDPELKSQIHQSGVQHFINKPYIPDEVVHTLQSLIDKES